MTAEELINYLSDCDVTPKVLEYEELGDYLYNVSDEGPTEEQESLRAIIRDWRNTTWEERQEARHKLEGTYPCGPAILVHNLGGGEGGGESVERVWHFPKHDIYLKATAYYYSYDGISGWSDLYEVKPRQVMTTVYE